ncbi:MAG: holo-ACP synthase [Hydrocarboniphaga effusa]|nr:holo-ACP synthase [Hydrocarboniphaga effusa]
MRRLAPAIIHKNQGAGARPRGAIYGVGVDILRVARIEKVYRRHGRRFVERLLHARELSAFRTARKPALFLAKCFAVKEAFVKALGTGFNGVAHDEVGAIRDKLGRPELVFGAKLKRRLDRLKIKTTHLSLSDEGGLVCAMVVLGR